MGGVPAWSGGGGVPAWSRGGVVYLPGPGGCTCLVPRGAPGQVLPPVDRMTHAYENITLPQTSFAGGKKGKKTIAN